MPQDGQVFSYWAQLVVVQADRCDWQNYDKDKAARDAILDDVKLMKVRIELRLWRSKLEL